MAIFFQRTGIFCMKGSCCSRYLIDVAVSEDLLCCALIISSKKRLWLILSLQLMFCFMELGLPLYVTDRTMNATKVIHNEAYRSVLPSFFASQRSILGCQWMFFEPRCSTLSPEVQAVKLTSSFSLRFSEVCNSSSLFCMTCL